MKQIPASLLTLLAGICVTLISLWVGQHHGLLPEQASEQAPLVDRFFSVMVTIGTALFLVVQGAILLFAIQFRKRDGDETDGVPIEGNFSLEIVWTAIPAIIVIGLGIYSVDVYEQMGGFAQHQHGMMAHHSTPAADSKTIAVSNGDLTAATDPAVSPAYGFTGSANGADQTADVVVNVLGMQYAWLFTYPNSGVTIGELHVPRGKSVQLNLKAQDVIHSFWVPQFRVKQDVIPGQAAQFGFVATKVGTFPVVCTELCGSYHGSMRTQLIVHEPEDYDAWLAETQVAQANGAEAVVAAQPAERSNKEFLAPYAEAIGINAAALMQLQPDPL